MPRIKTWLLILPLFNSACASGQENSDFCKLTRPIYLSKKDSVSDETARQILEFDDTGRILCGWQHV